MLQRPIFGYDPASGRFAMVAGAGTVKLWNLEGVETGDEASPRVFRVDNGPIVAVAFATAQTLVTVHERGTVVGWGVDSVEGGKAQKLWQEQVPMTVASAVGRRHGEELAIGGVDGGLVVLRPCDEGAGPMATVESAHADKIEVLVFSNEGDRLATLGRDRQIRVWSLHFEKGEQQQEEATLSEACRLTGSGGWPLCAAFSSDGRRLASGCMDNGVYVWDLEGGDRLGVRYEHYGWVEDIEWLAGDEAVVSASWDETLGIFQAHPLRPLMQIMHHDDYVVRVLPVPGTSFVAAASYDTTVTIWDWKDGSLKGVLEGHDDWVTELVWVGDGRMLSISSDRTARLWSVETMSQLAILGDSVVQSIDLSGDFDLGDLGTSPPLSSFARSDSHSSVLIRQFDPDDPLASNLEHETAAEMLDRAVEESGIAMAMPGSSPQEIEAVIGDELSEDSEVEEPPESADGDSEAEELREQESGGEDRQFDDGESRKQESGGEDRQFEGEAPRETQPDSDEPSEIQSHSEEEDPALQPDDDDPLPTGVGDELSDLVLDAISDIEDDAEQASAQPGDDDDGSTVDEEAVPDDDGPKLRPGSEDEEENSLDDDELGDEKGSLKEVSEEEGQKEESEVGLGIMDSVFDSISEAGGVDDDEACGLTPTSSPDYDPQPLTSVEEVQPFLPDDDILDLAFAGSGNSDDQEESSDDGGADEAGEDEAELEEEPFEGGEKDGKPSSWERSSSSQTLTRGKPLTAVDDAPAKKDVQSVHRKRKKTPQGSPGVGRFAHLSDEAKGMTQTPFSSPTPGPRVPTGGLKDTRGMTQTPFSKLPSSAPSPTEEMWEIGGRTQTPFTSEAGDEDGEDTVQRFRIPGGGAKLKTEQPRESAQPRKAIRSPGPKEDAEPSKADDDQEGGKESGKPRRRSPKSQSLLQRMARNLKARKKKQTEPKHSEVDRAEEEGKTQDGKAWLPDLGAGFSAKKKKGRTTTAGGGPKPTGSMAVSERVDNSGPSLQPGAPTGTPERTTTAGGGPSPFGPVGGEDSEGLEEDESGGEPGKDEAENTTPSEPRGVTDEEERGASADRANQTFMGRPGALDLLKVSEASEPSVVNEAEEQASSGQRGLRRAESPGTVGAGEAKTAAKVGGKDKREDDGGRQVEAPALGEEETAGGLEERTKGREKTGRIKTRGLDDDDTSSQLNREESKSSSPDGSGSSSSSTPPQEGQKAVSVEEISLDELWERSKAAPEMGILRRRIDAGVAYDPAHQLKTGFRDQVAIAVSPQEKRLVTAGRGGNVALWSVTGDRQVQFSVADSSWMEVGFVDGERLIYGVDHSGGIALWLAPTRWDSEEGAIYMARVGVKGSSALCCGAIDEEGEYLLVGTEQGQAQLWSLASGKCVLLLEGHNAAVSAVAFGKKGPITASVNGQIRFWNRQGFQYDQIDVSGRITDLVASGGLILWTEASGALRLMAEGASKATKLQGHYGEGRAVTFREDGYAVAGGEDGRLLVYDGKEAELAQEIAIPAPICRVVMKRKVLAASCGGGMVFVFRRVAKKGDKR